MFQLKGVLALFPALLAAGCGSLSDEGEAAEVSQPVADRAKCDAQASRRRFVSRDKQDCQAVFFVCARGESPFFDSCGCGCSFH